MRHPKSNWPLPNSSVWKRSLRYPTIVLALLVAGCAGTRIQNVQQSPAQPGTRVPQTIAVVVENDSPPPVKEKHRAEQLEDAQALIQELRDGLTKKLTARGLTVLPGGAADIVLFCRIEALSRGHKSLRIIVGFGAGKAVLQTNVAVVEARSGTTLLTFDTQSTTGSMPGAGVGAASNGAAVAGKALGVAGGLRSGLASEADQTIEKIDKQLGIYFGERKWPYNKAS